MGKLFEIEEDSKVKSGGNGYYYVTTDPPHPCGEVRGDRKKKYIYLHRAVLENKLGRYLDQDEQSHHVDGDKENNSPENLELAPFKEHQKEHALKTKFWKASPLNKPGRKTASVFRVVLAFLKR